MSPGRVFPAVACLLLLASICLWLILERTRLLSENKSLIAAAESQTSTDNNADQLQPRAQANESEGYRQEHAELLRLRAEVSELRRQLKEARLVTTKNERPATNNPSSPDDSSPALEHYVSHLQASVPWQQTLVTGGWQLPSGKHGLFFVQPHRVNAAGNEDYDSTVPGQILLETWIAEIPDDVLSRSGLASLKTYAATDARHALLSAEQAQGVIKVLEQTSGVDILRPPNVTTLDGRQTSIAIGPIAIGDRPATSGPQPGPALEFTPVVLSGGAGVDLKLSANLWLPKQ